MIKIGVIGGAGYTAGELLRLLINHPEADIRFVHSESNAGRKLADVHDGLIGETDMEFTSSYDLNGIDLLFLCSAHGKSREYWTSHSRPAELKIIDLAQDFRDESCGYVYGLPELNRKRIAAADSVANPGCFATAIQLSLLPLAYAGLLPSGELIHVTGITGSTGAGVKPVATTHFSWRNDNISVYKPFSHQHIKEIEATFAKLQPHYVAGINFIPMRGDFSRGIFTIVYLPFNGGEMEAVKLYKDFYSDSTFTVVSDNAISLKQAVNTNKALLHLEVHDGTLLITCAEDNLLKGASGQAVQNMNLMFGLPEDTGLRLKSSAF